MIRSATGQCQIFLESQSDSGEVKFLHVALQHGPGQIF